MEFLITRNENGKILSTNKAEVGAGWNGYCMELRWKIKNELKRINITKR